MMAEPKLLLRNDAPRHARKALSGSGTERARADASLATALTKALTGSTIYLPSFFTPAESAALVKCLADDVAQDDSVGGGVSWSKHLKLSDPSQLPTFRRIVRAMAEYFDVDVFAFRCNLYRDGSDWKPYHRDSHAYGNDGAKEDFTMGASFGAERVLSFRHEETGTEFAFPQRQGDVFAFSDDANKEFTHGVPRASSGEQASGLRFSIIAWGRRRHLHARNGGSGDKYEASCLPTPLAYADTMARDGPDGTRALSAGEAEAEASTEEKEAASEKPALANELVLPTAEVASLMRSTSAMGVVEVARDGAVPQRDRRSRRGIGGGGEPRVPGSHRNTKKKPVASASGGRVLSAVRDRVGSETFANLREVSLAYQRGAMACGAYVTKALGLVDVSTLREVVRALPDDVKRRAVENLVA